jgi:hypothetical protein
LFFDCPHAAFFFAVSVGKILIKCAGIAYPAALHIDRHAANNLPRAILDDAIGNNVPVEVFLHVKPRFLVCVVRELHRRTACHQ